MAITFGRNFWCLCSSLLLVIAASPAHAETKLFESVQVTPSGEYTFGIEGPAADLDGNLFVVNFGKPGTIGKAAGGRRGFGAVYGTARGQRRQRHPLCA
ncbi:hypothetical protein ACVW0J_009094 [Bradyrhizobium sp. i1.7.7]